MSKFKYDIFISYAHLDNEPDPATGPPGWVTELTDNLQLHLTRRAGIKGSIKVWSDRKIDESEPVTQQLEDSVKNSAVLVAILSPSFMNSKWCLEEVDIFLSESRKRNRINLPIFLLEIYDTTYETRPEILKDRNPKKFWVFDEETKSDHPIGYPLLRALDNHEKAKFLRHVGGLAREIVIKLADINKIYEEKAGKTDEDLSDADISVDDDTSMDPVKSKMVFINMDEGNRDVAERVKKIVEKKGYKAFLHSVVPTKNAQHELSNSYINCMAAIIIASSDNQDWLMSQLLNLKKFISMRKQPLRFLWILTQESKDWLEIFKNFIKINFKDVPEKKILFLKGSKATEIHNIK